MACYRVTLESEGPFIQTLMIEANDVKQAKEFAREDCNCNDWMPVGPFIDVTITKVEKVE